MSGRRVGDRQGDRKRPEDRLYAIHHEVHSETISLYREARMKLERQVGHSLSDDDFILMMSRTVLEGPKDSGRANHQISMTVCEDCGRGRQQAGGVDVEVAPEVVEMARCDAQIVSGAHVGAQGAAPASQDVTPATRREVVARDRGRCAVPGCRNCVYVDIHHVVPRARGGSHQAQNLILLCGAHHRAHHRGRLGIRGDSTGVKFFHADGTPYGSGQGRRPGYDQQRRLPGSTRWEHFRSGGVQDNMPKLFLYTIAAFATAALATAAATAAGPKFTRGVHLNNQSNKAVEIRIHVGPGPISTSICFVAEPTDGIKNGLDPAFLRDPAGFTRLGHDKDGIWAEVAANTRVLCVCATPCTIEMGEASVMATNRSTVLISTGGQLSVREW